MAMQNWIAMRTDLDRDPHVIKLGQMMEPKVRSEVVVGYLWKVWCWADQVTDDGVIRGVTLDAAEEVLHLPGFMKCMTYVGWLEYVEDANGCVIVFPGWDTWMGNSTKKRLKDAKSKQLRRKSRGGQERGQMSAEKGTNVRDLADPKGTPCSSSSSSSSSSIATPTSIAISFDTFWAVVPKKVAKQTARTAYGRAIKKIREEKPDVDAYEYLLERMTAYAASDIAKTEFCCNPATWLNGGRWDDDDNAWRNETSEERAARMRREEWDRGLAAERSRMEAQEEREAGRRCGRRSDADAENAFNESLNKIQQELGK